MIAEPPASEDCSEDDTVRKSVKHIGDHWSGPTDKQGYSHFKDILTLPGNDNVTGNIGPDIKPNSNDT